jgi:RHS repeat-associated protein
LETSKVLCCGREALTYDAENRLTGVSGGANASFAYDGDGNRVKGTVNGVTTVYVGNYYEYNVNTGVATSYYYAGSTRVAMRQGSAVYYLFGDHLGSTSVSYRVSDGQTLTQRYYAWGGIRPGPNNALPTDYTFTGQKLDATGLMYYGARYYDSALGRFLSADTNVPGAGNPQDLNRYTYARNNPLAYVDPNGHNPIPIIMGIAAFAATAFLAVEGGKMAYGELTIQVSDAIREATAHPMGGGTPFEPIALRAAINIQEMGMLYDDFPGNNSIGLGAVRTDVAEQHGLGKYTQSQLQNDHVLNVKLRAALMAQELAQCKRCSKTDQYIVLALAQNDSYGVAEGFRKQGWDAILKHDDEMARSNNGIRALLLKLTDQGWNYGRMRFELGAFVAQLRKLQSQGAKLPDGVNLDYIECLGNGGEVSQCSH